MAGSVIKEFLVALGFKIDDAGLRKFETGLGRATKGAVELGSAISATVSVVEAAVLRVSRQFEDLYYASRRSGAAVSSLQAFEYAYRQIGVTGDRTRSAVEGVARAMRSSPGIGALLNQLGVKTQGRDTTQILSDFVGQMRKLPFYLSSQYGQALNIDPDTLLMLMQGWEKTAAAVADYRKRQKDAGVDADADAKKFTDFSSKFETFLSNLDILWTRVAKDFLPFADKFLDWANSAVILMNRLDVATGGWAYTIGTIAVTAMGAFLAKAALMKLLFRGGAAAAAVEGGAAVAGGAAAGAAARGGLVAGALRLGARAGPLAFLTTLLWPDEANAGEDEETARRHAGGGGAGTLGQRNNNPGNLRSWGDNPVVGGFARFGTAAQGMSALARQLLLYGERGYNSVQSIISRYAPSSENDTGAYIGHVSQQTGFAPNQSLNLRDPSVLRKLMSAIVNHENGGNPFGEDAVAAGANARLGVPGATLGGGQGGGNVTLNQKTEINLHGGAAAGGREGAVRVLESQKAVNSDLVRNLAGAVT